MEGSGHDRPAVRIATLQLIRRNGSHVSRNLTQPKLASVAGLGLSTIVDFERARRPVSIEVIQAIRSALEDAGVEFIGENGGGPGVRLCKGRRPKQPK